MTEQPYSIAIDRDRSLVRMELFGLWDVRTVERYAADAQKALADLKATSGPKRVRGLLIDLRRHGVQSREVTERIQAELRNGVSHGARHAVLVSESALHKLQAQRVGALLGAAFFTAEADAIDWLLIDP